MRDVFYRPTRQEEGRRPYLEAPRPTMPIQWEPAQRPGRQDERPEEVEAPRVIIIDI